MAERYAVVSCHVERPLDDRVWEQFARLQARAPGGFRIAALMRLPAETEPERRWVERAREAAARGPLGHHTHFGGPERARPAGEDPVAIFRREREWLEARGVSPRFFCGGGWFMDAALAAEVAAAGYADCSAIAFPLPWLRPGESRLELDTPARLLLPDGSSLLELPTTHSLGGACRSLPRLRGEVVHVHFHDWELLQPRRRVLLAAVLGLLGRLRTPTDLDELAGRARATAPIRPIAEVLRT